MTAARQAVRSTTSDHRNPVEVLQRGLGDLLARGAIAGLFSGFVFLLANMGWAVKDDKPAAAPMIDIATIFHTQDVPRPVQALEFGADNLVVGTTTHLMLSMLFGIGFALLASLALRHRGPGMLALAGVGYGLLLYVVNFQVLGRIFFEWFTDPMGPPQGFEAFIHAVFGLLLVPFFLGAIGRSSGRLSYG
jgi:uncharacterized membrane protein YagU involved in acid resistance